MNWLFYTRWLATIAFYLGVTMVNETAISSEVDMSPRVKKLIHESKAKKSICTSSLFDKNPLASSDISQALAYIKTQKDYSSYFLLHAIHQYYPREYGKVPGADKAAILCSALESLEWMNDWGHLSHVESFDGRSAKLLLSLGTDALKTLTPLLNNGNPALLFKSEGATMSSAYQYRRKDFAYRYITLILGAQPAFDPNPGKRDKDIEKLKQFLKNAKE